MEYVSILDFRDDMVRLVVGGWNDSILRLTGRTTRNGVGSVSCGHCSGVHLLAEPSLALSFKFCVLPRHPVRVLRPPPCIRRRIRPARTWSFQLHLVKHGLAHGMSHRRNRNGTARSCWFYRIRAIPNHKQILSPFQIISRLNFFASNLITCLIQKFVQNIISLIVGCFINTRSSRIT